MNFTGFDESLQLGSTQFFRLLAPVLVVEASVVRCWTLCHWHRLVKATRAWLQALHVSVLLRGKRIVAMGRHQWHVSVFVTVFEGRALLVRHATRRMLQRLPFHAFLLTTIWNHSTAIPAARCTNIVSLVSIRSDWVTSISSSFFKNLRTSLIVDKRAATILALKSIGCAFVVAQVVLADSWVDLRKLELSLLANVSRVFSVYLLF